MPFLHLKQTSFVRAQEWVSELRKNQSLDILIALVGNKIDMEEQRVVETQVKKCAFAASYSCLYCFSFA